VQRYLSSRSLRQARAALLASGLVVLGQFALFLLLGVGIYVLQEEGIIAGLSDRRYDEVFALFVVSALPAGLAGLVIAAVLASAMGTLSSSLSSAASASVADFYQPLCRKRSEADYLRVSHAMVLFWGLARVAVALAAFRLLTKSVIEAALAVAGFTTGTILGLFLLGRMPWSISSRAALVGLAGGFAAVTGLWLPSAWGRAVVAWPWYAPVGTLVTFGVAGVIALVERGSSDNRGPEPGLPTPG